jgi:membrane protease YdiL (CAAX protease family)
MGRDGHGHGIRRPRRWRGPLTALVSQLGIVAAAFVLTHILARRFGVPGPGTWAVLCALAVATWRLRRAGMRWDELGMRAPENWWIALAWVAALYAAAALAKILVIDPLAKVLGWPPINLSRFSKLPGNAAFLAGGLFLVWVQAAFGEELVFRGFLLTRLELLLGGELSATAMALVGQALLFGVGHWYLGPRGVTTAGITGLILGAVYLCDGRNLVPLIGAHGLADSLGLIAIYARIARVT